MKRISLIVLSVLLLSVIAVVSVSAQSGNTTAVDPDAASISIVETLPVTASVDININGEIYKVAIPATVIIDAQKDLAEALLKAQSVDRVGDLQWKITEITEHEDTYALSQFSTVEPSSPDNKLVVVASQLTNLDSEPFGYYPGISDLYAYDNTGNLYDPADYDCDDINPGDTITCTIVFDVPKTVLILGLDMKVYDHKRISYQ